MHMPRAPFALHKTLQITRTITAIKFDMTAERGRWVSNSRKCVRGSQHVRMWWAGVIRSSLHCHYCVHTHTQISYWNMLNWLPFCVWSREVCGSCSPPTVSSFSVLSRQVKLPPYIFWLWHIDCEPKERLSSHLWCCCLLWTDKSVLGHLLDMTALQKFTLVFSN